MSAVVSAAKPLESVHKMSINRKPKSENELSYQAEAGRQLTRARMEKNLEVEQLAEFLKGIFVGDIGFNRTSLYKHEKGDRTLTPYRLKCISDALEIPISSLFDKKTCESEVSKIHAKTEIHAPYNLKKIQIGDALITESVDFENPETLLDGYYVFIANDGTLKLCHIYFSENKKQYVYECNDGLQLQTISDFTPQLSSLTYIRHVKYIISKV